METKFQGTEGLCETGAFGLHLMESYFSKGYHLFTDNSYKPASLAEYMWNSKTHITGTLKGDRKSNPK